jgi:hypothetical protein
MKLKLGKEQAERLNLKEGQEIKVLKEASTIPYRAFYSEFIEPYLNDLGTIINSSILDNSLRVQSSEYNKRTLEQGIIEIMTNNTDYSLAIESNVEVFGQELDAVRIKSGNYQIGFYFHTNVYSDMLLYNK